MTTGHADIIILSCQKYKNGDMSSGHSSGSWSNIKENFKEQLLFIFSGDEKQDKLFEYNESMKELSIRTSDEYDNIPTKTWLAYYFWFYHILNKKTHLITFGDDCSMIDEKLFINTRFNKIDYGGNCIHYGTTWINNWHQTKVKKSSHQYNRESPRPNINTNWVHEGAGVVFSQYAIECLLNKHNLCNDIMQVDIDNFTNYVNETCWYNDVLLSHEFAELNIVIKPVEYYGINGDK